MKSLVSGKVVLSSNASISALGSSQSEIWNSYSDGQSKINTKLFRGEALPVSALDDRTNDLLDGMIEENPSYRALDRSVLLALHAARGAVEQAGWNVSEPPPIGVIIGSSRGATGLFEKYHRCHCEDERGRVPTQTSPTTTLGNVSSWVSKDLGVNGYIMSHSVTCSTALHSIANAYAWLRAGLMNRFVVGGTEAPLTNFTLAQMKALRIYSEQGGEDFPCQPCMDGDETPNTLVLGEGASLFCIELKGSDEVTSNDCIVESIGYSVELPTTSTSMTDEGLNLKDAMSMAVAHMETEDPVDAVVLHAPGTRKGDRAELCAINSIFGEEKPALLSNKWLIGHTFGASGAFSLELGKLVLENQQIPNFPYSTFFDSSFISDGNRPIKKVMVNAAGFGGNAVSVIISRGINGNYTV